MNTIQFLEMSMNASREMALMLINDLKDEPVTKANPERGNHATWILGHLAYIESVMLHQMIGGKDSCPLSAHKPLFDAGGEPFTDVDMYPSFDSLLKDFMAARSETLNYLRSCNPEDLDKQAPGCPEDWKPFFGTVAQCLDFISHHPSTHFGQLADIRRSLGRKPLLG